jgi:Prokaryotic N-terminal methylation motif
MRTIRGHRPDSGITLVEVLVAIFVLAELESIRALEHQGYRDPGWGSRRDAP